MAKPFLLCYHVDGKKYEGIKVGIQGSQTEKNLQKAFDIVSKRRSEYDIYALIAQREGLEDVSRLLARFAEHEKAHAKLWYRWLNSEKPSALINYIENALKNEKEELEGIYESFARTAEEEGFEHIAGLFTNIENIEKIHYDRLKKLIYKLKDETPANPDGTYNWVCSTCGAIFVQKEEPPYCPLCLKEEVFFYKKPD